MTQSKPLIILGGRSLVAPYLMQRLTALGRTAAVISRREMVLPSGFTSTPLDLTTARHWVVPEDAEVISLVPIWVLAKNLPRFMGANSIIAVSSTSRFSKVQSTDPKEQKLAENLKVAEEMLIDWSASSNVAYTILRPTLIYDGIDDENITRVAAFIRRFGFLPVGAPAQGLRQPIHADDVAEAIIGALENPTARNKEINIAGGEILTYRAMIERIFAALGKTPRLLPLPTALLGSVFQAASKIGALREKSFGYHMFARMNEDLIFDCKEGLELLNYDPRSFAPAFNTNTEE